MIIPTLFSLYFLNMQLLYEKINIMKGTGLLLAQWSRICLPMQEPQETQVLFLSLEDPLED